MSTVIPTRNRAKILTQNIEALEHYGVDEIVVVDGASMDETPNAVHQLQTKYPNIIYLRSLTREGSPRARNTGLAHATGDIILLLDDDQILTNPRALSAIKDNFQQHPDVGIIGAAVKDVIQPTLDPPFNLPSSLALPLTRLTGFIILERVSNHRHLINYAASAMAMRRQVVTQIQYDAMYQGTAYREESDFQLATRKQGWTILFDPRFQILHYGQDVGGNRGQLLYQRLFWKARNHTYFLMKHYSGFQLIWYLLCSLLILGIYAPQCITSMMKGIKQGLSLMNTQANLSTGETST